MKPARPMPGRRVLAMGAALWLAGCATAPTAEPASAPDIRQPVAQTVNRMAGAATTPLQDLNLVRDEIPAVLLAARAQPYAVPADPSCAALAQELRALNAALGPDLDAPASVQPPTDLVVQGVAAAGDAAVQMVRSTTESLMPLRSWVRRFSGAQQQSRDQADAMAAGSFRRAFLRGYARARGCEPAP